MYKDDDNFKCKKFLRVYRFALFIRATRFRNVGFFEGVFMSMDNLVANHPSQLHNDQHGPHFKVLVPIIRGLY